MDIVYADPVDYDYDDYYDDKYLKEEYHLYGGLICMYDYLEIRDGASKQSPLIDGYCGDASTLSLPIQIQTTQENAWMRCAN